jgi:hypothetical protein
MVVQLQIPAEEVGVEVGHHSKVMVVEAADQSLKDVGVVGVVEDHW